MKAKITTFQYEPSVQDFIMKQVREGLDRYKIHESCASGIALYVECGIQPGSFLRAVLANDLIAACFMADHTNRTLLGEYACLLTFHLPQECWGHPEKVKTWIKHGGLKGK